MSAISFEAHGQRPHPHSAWCLELEGGDVIYGNLVGLSKELVQFDSPGLGLLHIKRSAIQRLMHSRDNSDLVYSGPNGLLEWSPSPAGAWEQDGGQLFTARDEATIEGEFSLPKRACIDFELSWTSEPDFTLAFGATPEVPKKDPVFRINVWDSQLILLGEVAKKADFVTLQKLAHGPGRCHFQVYLDQEHPRAIVIGADGNQVADLNIADTSVKPGGNVRLVNHHGNVRLEMLSISRWNGQPPHVSQGGKSRVDRSDGVAVNSEVEAFDAQTQEFVVAEGDRKSRIKADTVESIVLPSSAKLSVAGSPPARGLRVLCDNGVRLSGNLRKVENARMWLKHPGIVEPIGIDLFGAAQHCRAARSQAAFRAQGTARAIAERRR